MKSKNIPAIPYLKIVLQFAMAHGLRFYTVKDQRNAIELYERNASVKN